MSERGAYPAVGLAPRGWKAFLEALADGHALPVPRGEVAFGRKGART
jgi:hypothetical protein